MLTRRWFMGGMACALAAPAIVHAGNIMPVKALDLDWINVDCEEFLRQMNDNLYGDLAAVTRAIFLPRLCAQVYKSSPLMTNFTVDGEWMQ
jgi:hypothetical protein